MPSPIARGLVLAFALPLTLASQGPPPRPTAADSARDASTRHRNGRTPRAARATFTATPPKLDGRLDDAVWATTSIEADFKRDVPSDGLPAAQQTEVRVLYDREALYIGARLHDDRPG